MREGMRPPFTGSKRLSAVTAFFLALSPRLAHAQQKTGEYEVDSIQVLNNSAATRFRADYWITEVLGVVGGDGIPETIYLGDVITVEGRTLTVNYIFVTECLVELKWAAKVLCEKGQVQCLLVERLEDVPSDRGTHRLWITVDQCRPLAVLSDDL
jgi:hypothetical protein